MTKERLDQALVSRGLAESREKGKALIMAGSVFVNHKRIDKPGTAVAVEDEIEVQGARCPYVSRGGFKLQKALKEFALDIQGKTMLDIGASTGGFTDCALQEGVQKVYAVDVGYGQLDWKLRQDSRVTSIERKNARYLTAQEIPVTVDLISIDVSFISLGKIFPAVLSFLKEEGYIVALIKPQFEAGRDKVGKKGVVRDAAVHRDVISNVWDEALKWGLNPVGLSFSPITGPQGNIEFLLCLQKQRRLEGINKTECIALTVKQAHEILREGTLGSV